MPVTLKLDRLENSRIEESQNQTTYVRSGEAWGIDTATPSQTIISALVSAGLPALGSAKSINGAQCVLNRRIIVPRTDSHFAIQLVYESPDKSGGGPGVTFVLRDSTGLTNESVQIDSRTWEPYQVVYLPPAAGSKPQRKNVTYNRMVPLRTLVAEGIIVGAPADGPRNTVGKVNEFEWFGLDAGYWFHSAFESSTQNNGYSYSVSVQFISRVYRDWSDYSFYVDDTGAVPASVVADASSIIAIMNQSYAPTTVRINGFMKAGQYSMDDFAFIFGIG